MKSGIMNGPLETAVRLLAMRDHTELEMRLKLQQKNFSPGEIDKTVEILREKGYLNDQRVKQLAMEKILSEKRHGAQGITMKLRQIGLQVSMAEIRQYYSEDEECEVAFHLLRKKFRSLDADMIPRYARFLGNRGFYSTVISRVLDECRKHQ